MYHGANILSALRKHGSIALIVSVLVYVTVRAAMINITHDEAYSFYNMKKFWYAEALCTGNTHWLNSVAIKLAILANFEHVAAIRWLSIVSTIIVCLLVARWIRGKKPADQFIFVAVILCNPYILDYLSIARGYAAGMMLEFTALYCFTKGMKEHNEKTIRFSLFAAGLSPLANFSYIYFFLAFCFVYFTKVYFTRPGFLKQGKFYTDGLFSLGIATLVARAFLFITRCSNDVVGAGTEYPAEFFHVFADSLLYMKWSAGFNALTILGILIFCVPVISSVYGIFYCRTNALYFYSSCLFTIILVTIILNHIVFHLVLPYYRSTVFVFPVAAVSSACFLTETGKRRKYFTAIISFTLILNLVFSANFKWVFDFKIQCNLKESMDYAESLGAKHVGISPELYGGYRNYHQMTWKYYYPFFGETINTNLPKGKSKDSQFLSRFDHLILFPPYDLSFYSNNRVKLKGLKLFPETGTLVAKVEK